MISEFLEKNFRHFNAAACVDAANGWIKHLEKGGKMFLTLAGAMSTAEIGITLSELIRCDLIHGICCTGANLEEDFFLLVAKNSYLRVPNYRDLSKKEETKLYNEGYNRVTDTCIPESAAIQLIGHQLEMLWKKAEAENKKYFPHEYFYQLFENKTLSNHYQGNINNSWLYAAYKKKIPIFVPGWEDSTLGNIFVAKKILKIIQDFSIVKNGFEQLEELSNWYLNCKDSIGFFQIGGGIAGDFPICVVPLLRQDLKKEAPLWDYFCQISDSTTSYGSYSGAVPNEKITWGKISEKTPSYIIESDATIVAPLIFQYILEKTQKNVI
jgi:deoxyhypusine synthase